MNPYETSQSVPTRSDDMGCDGVICSWREHTILVTAQMVPRFLPLVGQFFVSIDHGAPITSSQLRWQERFDFTISDSGKEIPATFQSYGFAIGRQPFRIHIDGVLFVESTVPVKRWWIGVMLGVCIGFASVAMCFIAIAAILFWR
jgi:hypothetical protein